MMTNKRLELGVKVRDVVTGYEGIITGAAQYISGCEQYLVVPKIKNGVASAGAWYDWQRLVVVNSKPVLLASLLAPSKKPLGGGPQSACPGKCAN
jgi:hypothetical protein